MARFTVPLLWWFLLFGALPGVAAAADAPARHRFDVAAGPAVSTLKRAAQQAGFEIVYSAAVVEGVQTHAITGEFTPREALERMVANTPLRVFPDPRTGAWSVLRQPSADPPSPSPLSAPKEPPRTMKPKNIVATFAGWLALTLAPAGPAQEATRVATAAALGNGTLTGTVSNAATKNLLEGARVDLPQLGLSVLSDPTGRFLVGGIPAGSYEVVVSYLGLDSARTQVTVSVGQRALRDFDLTSGVYRMEEFKVTGEREGDAAAITAQRNALNVKNVIASDVFGNLPNLSASEVVMRMPGVAVNTNAGGVNATLIVRGMGNNIVTLDGGLMTGEGGGMNRATQINNVTAAMIESVELIKGHTPDKGAESLGGTINLKSRSPLTIAEKRRITYNFGARLAPSFTEQIPLREQHRLHPLLNLSYQEVFGLFGEPRNLGVALNFYYSENIVNRFSTNREFQNTTASPAYLWDFGNVDQFANRKLSSVNLKVDYQLSPATRLTFNGIYNDNNGSDRISHQMRAFTAQTVGTTGTAGILSGYTDLVTEVRAVAGSTIDVTASQLNTWDRMRHFTVGLEHKCRPFELDLAAQFSRDHINSANDGESGTLVQRISNVGWVLDRTASDIHPRFTQTAGADITNPANYRPTANGFNNQNNSDDQDVREVRGNVRYELPFRGVTQASVKTGFLFRENEATRSNRTRRWSYLGTTGLPSDPTIVTSDGLGLPRWNPSQFIQERNPVGPALWREDLYFYEQNKFTGTQSVTEAITAGYAMVQGRIGRTGLLAGVRTERTEIESAGWTRARIPSTAALQLADPVGSAQRDYANNRRELDGSYTKSFPSVHLSHDLNQNLKARLSWSTSFGRPVMTNYLPTETISEPNLTLTVNNPSLQPQTAANWDASLDYYFEPVGNFSVGWFHKKIEDFIVRGIFQGIVAAGAANGYNGEYAGFSLLTTANAGTAFVQGWEFSYQQQFTFLPGVLKGLSALVNYTVLDTHGNFGDTTTLSAGQVAGFIPRTGNASLGWRYRKFGTRLLVNYTSDWLQTYSATSAAQNLYRYRRTTVNLGVEYRLRPWANLTCDVSNLTNEPTRAYRGFPHRLQAHNVNGTTITFGVNGRF